MAAFVATCGCNRVDSQGKMLKDEKGNFIRKQVTPVDEHGNRVVGQVMSCCGKWVATRDVHPAAEMMPKDRRHLAHRSY